MFSLCFRICQIVLDVQLVFQNVSNRFRSSVSVSECVRSLSMFSLCFRMCQIALCSVCVSECVGSLSMFSLCFRMCQIAFSVQFVFQNVSDHS
jgi:hypothetical protein